MTDTIGWIVFVIFIGTICRVSAKVLLNMTESESQLFCDLIMYSGTGIDAADAIQNCIDQNVSDLMLPPGLYTLSKGLLIPYSIKISSSVVSSPCSLDDASLCPILQASTNFYSTVGIVTTTSKLANVWIDHLVIDGNRINRLQSVAAADCAGDVNNRDGGRNLFFNNCENCKFTNSISANALCASGFVWTGAKGVISNNTVVDNGDHLTQMMWADGLTCLICDGATISGNTFIGNTDIDLIVGSGTGALIHNNFFYHEVNDLNRSVFSALMFDNFNGGTSGNFDGCKVTSNTISCNPTADMCCFGIQLGPHPWYASEPIAGNYFEVSGNEINGAGVGINSDAAGNDVYPVTLMDNVITDTREKFTCGALCGTSRSGSEFNYSPDSRVEYHNNEPTSFTTYKC